MGHLEGPEAGEDAEEAGFAAAVGAHDHDGTPLWHLERQLPHQPRPVGRVQRHPASCPDFTASGACFWCLVFSAQGTSNVTSCTGRVRCVQCHPAAKCARSSGEALSVWPWCSQVLLQSGVCCSNTRFRQSLCRQITRRTNNSARREPPCVKQLRIQVCAERHLLKLMIWPSKCFGSGTSFFSSSSLAASLLQASKLVASSQKLYNSLSHTPYNSRACNVHSRSNPALMSGAQDMHGSGWRDACACRPYL